MPLVYIYMYPIDWAKGPEPDRLGFGLGETRAVVGGPCRGQAGPGLVSARFARAWEGTGVVDNTVVHSGIFHSP